jgi:hypothetical protein
VRRSVLPSVLLAAAIGVAYLLIAPVSQDLAAAVFRADLFSRAGFVVVDDAWYGGHHVPAYSLLMPPLASWLGPRLLMTIAVVVAAGLFAALAEGAFPRRGARVGALWFAAAVAAQLFTGRVTFLLGLPLALGALLAAQRGRPRLAIALALLTALTGPVDAAFLALAGVAWAVADPRRAAPDAEAPADAGAPAPTEGPPPRPRPWSLATPRVLGIALAVFGLGPVVVLTLLFPEGGTEPFVASAFWPAFVVLAALALLLPKEDRTLRAGAALYALAVLACFVLPTAVGGNVTRLVALAAGPLVACVAWPRHRALVLALALPFVYWQLMPAIRDATVADGDPSTQAAYYAPLIAELHRREPTTPIRIEVPFTRSHWEAARLAPHVALARGWERQLDRERNALFYADAPLTNARFTAWLHENAVAYVALPDAELDSSARQEARLLRAGVPGLSPVWRNPHWTLYAVADAAALGVTALGPDGFTVQGARPRVQTVRVRFSPHWAVVSGTGCVSRSSGDFTTVRTATAGPIRVGSRFDPVRALLHGTGERCHGEITAR